MELLSSEYNKAVRKTPSRKILPVNDSVGLAAYKLQESDLDRQRLEKLMSSYLQGGFHQDKLSIVQATFYEDGADVEFNVDDYFMPSDGVFHLSSLLAEVCLTHAGVMYSHIDNGLTVKTSEVYLRSINFNFRKPIRDTRFSLSFQVTKKISKGHLRFYHASFSFNNDNFIGKSSWMMPLGGDC